VTPLRCAYLILIGASDILHQYNACIDWNPNTLCEYTRY
jgi:hypothetical protein